MIACHAALMIEKIPGSLFHPVAVAHRHVFMLFLSSKSAPIDGLANSQLSLKKSQVLLSSVYNFF